MMTEQEIPSFDSRFRDLNQFILDLVKEYNAGKIKSWDDLDERVKTFFTPERMDDLEAGIPGWKRMASYSNGITLTHVICVFLGLFMLPEYQSLSPGQKQLAKWIVLFHDSDKFHIRGKRDNTHAFRSAVLTANTLQGFGFPITARYRILINSWSQRTTTASVTDDNLSAEPIPDNGKLPEITSRIDNMFGEGTPAALITKGVLFHMSVNVVDEWPQVAPLSEGEIAKYIDRELLPLLKVMMLADNEGWSMFHPEDREKQRNETLDAFQRIDKIISP